MYLHNASHCRIIMDALYEEYRDYYSEQFSDEIEDNQDSLYERTSFQRTTKYDIDYDYDDYLHNAPLSELLDISGPCTFVSLRFLVDKYH